MRPSPELLCIIALAGISWETLVPMKWEGPLSFHHSSSGKTVQHSASSTSQLMHQRAL